MGLLWIIINFPVTELEVTNVESTVNRLESSYLIEGWGTCLRGREYVAL